MAETVFVAQDPHEENGQWVSHIVREQDGRVMATFAVTEEILPPRKNKKGKVLWKLPKDGTCPKLGIAEKERLLTLFREERKAKKRERAAGDEQKKKEEKKLDGPARRLQRVLRRWLWRRRFALWVTEAAAERIRSVKRYSRGELLVIRDQVEGRPFTQGLPPEVARRDAGTDPEAPLLPPPGIAPPPGIPGMGLQQMATMSSLGSTGSTESGDGLSLDGLEMPAQPHFLPGSPHGFGGPASDYSQPIRPAQPSPGTIGSIGTIGRGPTSLGAATPLEPEEGGSNGHLQATIDKEAWKAQWKASLLRRIDALAEQAWQQHVQSSTSVTTGPGGLSSAPSASTLPTTATGSVNGLYTPFPVGGNGSSGGGDIGIIDSESSHQALRSLNTPAFLKKRRCASCTRPLHNQQGPEEQLCLRCAAGVK